MRTHSFYVGVFLVALGSVAALELDGHLSEIWERNSGVIHDIARKRECKDGRIPILTDIKSDEGLITYRLECEHTLGKNGTDSGVLDRRQTQTLCTATCAQTCYTPADYNPDPKDCSKITASLKASGGTFDVSVGGIQVSQYNTCIYTFTNQAHTTLNFCNDKWADIGDKIAWSCGRWLSDPAKGGICNTTPYYVQAIRTPNMPGPSYTISFSTQAVTRLDSTSSTASRSTSTSQSSSSSSSGLSSSKIVSESTSLPGPLSSLNASGVVIQTLSDNPTMSLGQADASATGGNPTGSTEVPVSSNKQPNTAAAVGGAIGGVAFLALLIAAILLYKRRQQQKTLPDNTSTEFLSPMEHLQPWAIPVGLAYRSEKAPRHEPPAFANHSEISEDAATPIGHSDVTSSIISSQSPGPSYPAPHPRSTQALIAAAAPPNMSREQIDLLASNFISLVTGRRPQDDATEYGDGSELPPYIHE